MEEDNKIEYDKAEPSPSPLELAKPTRSVRTGMGDAKVLELMIPPLAGWVEQWLARPY